MLSYASITMLEFGMNETNGTIPDKEIYTDESLVFNTTLLPLFKQS